MIFQKATLQMCEWHLHDDVEPVNLYKEPDDHIDLGLSLLTHLAGVSLAALREQENDKSANMKGAQRGFLSKHMLIWATRLCDQVGVYYKIDFYRGIALNVRGILI